MNNVGEPERKKRKGREAPQHVKLLRKSWAGAAPAGGGLGGGTQHAGSDGVRSRSSSRARLDSTVRPVLEGSTHSVQST